MVLRGIFAGSGVDHAEEALRVDVEADRAVGRRAGIGYVGELAADGDVVELVRIGAGDELEIVGDGSGGRRDALQGIAGRLEARVGERIDDDVADDGVGGGGDGGDVAGLGIVGAIHFAIDGQGEELRDENGFLRIVGGPRVGDGDAARLGPHVGDGLVDGVNGGIDDGYAVGAGVGDVELAAGRGKRQSVGFGADGDGGQERIGGGRSAADVQHGYCAVYGIGDVGARAIGRQRDAIGFLADGNLGKARVVVLEVEERDGVVVRIGYEQKRIVRAQGQGLRTGGTRETGERLGFGMAGVADPGRNGRNRSRVRRES